MATLCSSCILRISEPTDGLLGFTSDPVYTVIFNLNTGIFQKFSVDHMWIFYSLRRAFYLFIYDFDMFHRSFSGISIWDRWLLLGFILCDPVTWHWDISLCRLIFRRPYVEVSYSVVWKDLTSRNNIFLFDIGLYSFLHSSAVKMWLQFFSVYMLGLTIGGIGTWICKLASDKGFWHLLDISYGMSCFNISTSNGSWGI